MRHWRACYQIGRWTSVGLGPTINFSAIPRLKAHDPLDYEGWVEWGGELIWAAGFTSGGAPYGLTSEEYFESTGSSPEDELEDPGIF